MIVGCAVCVLYSILQRVCPTTTITGTYSTHMLCVLLLLLLYREYVVYTGEEYKKERVCVLFIRWCVQPQRVVLPAIATRRGGTEGVSAF